MKLKYLKDDILYYWGEFYDSKFFIILPIILLISSLLFILSSYMTYSNRVETVNKNTRQISEINEDIKKLNKIEKDKEESVVKTYQASSFGNSIADYQNNLLAITDTDAVDYKNLLNNTAISKIHKDKNFFKKAWFSAGTGLSDVNWIFQSNFVTDKDEFTSVWTLGSKNEVYACVFAKYNGETNTFSNPKLIITKEGSLNFDEELNGRVNERLGL